MTSEHRFDHEFVRVLTIAGSDSGGGAGIQADLKTFAALGCYGMSAITALTAQNTHGVSAIHPVPADFLAAQIDAVLGDIGAHAVKIGMLHSAETVRTVAQAIDRHQVRHVVLDPVMVSVTGATLMEPSAVHALVNELFPRASLITPNLDEAALLLGNTVAGAADMGTSARILLRLGAQAVLLKGGHLKGEDIVDVLAMAEQPVRQWQDRRIDTPNLHGAGCTLSSAIAAQLALGLDLPAAVQVGRDYVRQALRTSIHVRTGSGVGPLNHASAPRAMQLRAVGRP